MSRRQRLMSLFATVVLALAAVVLTRPWLSAEAQGAAAQQQQEQQAPAQPPTEQPQAAPAQPGVDTSGLMPDEANTVQVVAMRGDSVVAVNVKVAGRRVSPFEDFPEESLPPFLRQFLRQAPPQQLPPQQGAGSGFVVDEQGRILTNYHVVSGALQSGTTDLQEGATVTVAFPSLSGQEFAVRVVGANAIYDLALLELVRPEDLPDGLEPIPLADTSTLMPGQKTIAIGNPYGFESTVTTGIVSAVGRHFPVIGQADIPLIQTDATINPGNSGGPLLNSRGEVIGVNTAIVPNISATGQAGFLGIGFAVPADIIRDALPQLAQGGVTELATRPRLGISIIGLDSYPPEVRRRLNLPAEGVGVIAVESGSSAERAGVRGSNFSIQVNGQELPVPGDIIVSVDGEPVTSASQLQNLVFRRGEGETVTLGILRDGDQLEVEVPLQVVPQQQQQGQPQQQQEDRLRRPQNP